MKFIAFVAALVVVSNAQILNPCITVCDQTMVTCLNAAGRDTEAQTKCKDADLTCRSQCTSTLPPVSCKDSCVQAQKVCLGAAGSDTTAQQQCNDMANRCFAGCAAATCPDSCKMSFNNCALAPDADKAACQATYDKCMIACLPTQPPTNADTKSPTNADTKPPTHAGSPTASVSPSPRPLDCQGRCDLTGKECMLKAGNDLDQQAQCKLATVACYTRCAGTLCKDQCFRVFNTCEAAAGQDADKVAACKKDFEACAMKCAPDTLPPTKTPVDPPMTCQEKCDVTTKNCLQAAGTDTTAQQKCNDLGKMCQSVCAPTTCVETCKQSFQKCALVPDADKAACQAALDKCLGLCGGFTESPTNAGATRAPTPQLDCQSRCSLAYKMCLVQAGDDLDAQGKCKIMTGVCLSNCAATLCKDQCFQVYNRCVAAAGQDTTKLAECKKVFELCTDECGSLPTKPPTNKPDTPTNKPGSPTAAGSPTSKPDSPTNKPASPTAAASPTNKPASPTTPPDTAGATVTTVSAVVVAAVGTAMFL